MIAWAVLVVGLLGLCNSITSSSLLAASSRDAALATQAAQHALESLGAVEFGEAFARFNGDAQDDPEGPSTAPGSGFAVDGLVAAPGNRDAVVGEFVFPVVEDAPRVLREDTVDPALGMPRDLNGDGEIDDQDHSGDYRLLPVLLRLAWQEHGRTTRLEFRTLLARY